MPYTEVPSVGDLRLLIPIYRLSAPTWAAILVVESLAATIS